jgi:hypothetical protein
MATYAWEQYKSPFAAWYRGYKQRHGTPTYAAKNLWAQDWAKKGGSTPSASYGVQPAQNMPQWMTPQYEKYRNLYWQAPDQGTMNTWNTEYWKGKPKRPWATASTGVSGQERLALGRQFSRNLFY